MILTSLSWTGRGTPHASIDPPVQSTDLRLDACLRGIRWASVFGHIAHHNKFPELAKAVQASLLRVGAIDRGGERARGGQVCVAQWQPGQQTFVPNLVILKLLGQSVNSLRGQWSSTNPVSLTILNRLRALTLAWSAKLQTQQHRQWRP